MYANLTLRTRIMLSLTRGKYQIARFCGYTVLNKTLQVNEDWHY